MRRHERDGRPAGSARRCRGRASFQASIRSSVSRAIASASIRLSTASSSSGVGVEPVLEVGGGHLRVELDAPGVVADPVRLQAVAAARQRGRARRQRGLIAVPLECREAARRRARAPDPPAPAAVSSTSYQPISGVAIRRTAPPSASAISSAPRQTPSSGTRSRSASARKRFSVASHGWRVLLVGVGGATEGQDRVVGAGGAGASACSGGTQVSTSHRCPRAHRGRRPGPASASWTIVKTRIRADDTGKSPPSWRVADWGYSAREDPCTGHRKFTITPCNARTRRLR